MSLPLRLLQDTTIFFICARLARQWAVSEIELFLPRLIAVSNNFLVARAAYEAAVKYNPRERWLLRDGIRVVERYQP
jgi:hypothetical protein